MAHASNTETKKFTKDCIIEALLKLLDEKKYEKITLTEIAEKAGVSRNAIYRNYESKDLILKNHIREISRSIAIEFRQKNIADYNEYIFFLLEKLYEHKMLCMKLSKAGLNNILLEAFFQVKGRFIVDKKIQDYYENYRIGGFFSICITWIENGCKETPDELFSIFCTIIKSDGIVPDVPKIKNRL